MNLQHYGKGSKLKLTSLRDDLLAGVDKTIRLVNLRFMERCFCHILNPGEIFKNYHYSPGGSLGSSSYRSKRRADFTAGRLYEEDVSCSNFGLRSSMN